jgi:hypothetical protein
MEAAKDDGSRVERQAAAPNDDLIIDEPDKQTTYTYLGSPAWRYDENELTLTECRTYGDWWRGLARINEWRKAEEALTCALGTNSFAPGRWCYW